MKNSLYLILFITVSSYGQTMELLSNYETVGINILLETSDPEMDAYGIVEYKPSSETSFIEGFPLSRVDNYLGMCSGSIFWLEDGTSYDVKVTIMDPTTDALNGIVRQGTVQTRTEPSFNVSGQTYNVTTDGAGSTFTLIQALTLAEAGDRILLANGKYHIGNLQIPNNGTPSAPIIIEGEGDEVILDGSYDTPFEWTEMTNFDGVYYTITPVRNPNLVIVDGERLYPHQTFKDLRRNEITADAANILPAGMSGFYRNPTLLPVWDPAPINDPGNITKNHLYVKFEDNANPENKDMIITQYETAFSLEDNSHITFKNLVFQYYGVGPFSAGLFINNSNNIVIEDCHFNGNNTGIELEGSSSKITIQNSLFEDYFVNWNSWKVKGTHEYVDFMAQRFPNGSRNLEKGGIVCDNRFHGRNIVIRNNTFKNYSQSGKLTPGHRDYTVDLDNLPITLEIDFYENEIINSSGDGFEIDGFARNVRVFKNRFEACHSPLSVAPAKDGPSYIIGNLFTDIRSSEYITDFVVTTSTGQPLKFQHGNDTVPCGEIFFYHNTIDAQNNAYGMNLAQSNVNMPIRKLDIKNNIFKTDNGIPFRVKTLTVPNVISDYNAFYSENSDTIAYVEIINASNEYYESISELTTNYNWEQHSLQTPPMFKNEENGDYTLEEGSPLTDSGIFIQGINEKFYIGAAPEIGMAELCRTIHTENIYPSPNSEIIIFPNPNNGHFNLISDIKINSLEVYNFTGIKIKDFRIENKSASIDLPDTPGIYYLNIQMEDGRSQTKKIIRK